MAWDLSGGPSGTPTRAGGSGWRGYLEDIPVVGGLVSGLGGMIGGSEDPYRGAEERNANALASMYGQQLRNLFGPNIGGQQFPGIIDVEQYAAPLLAQLATNIQLGQGLQLAGAQGAIENMYGLGDTRQGMTSAINEALGVTPSGGYAPMYQAAPVAQATPDWLTGDWRNLATATPTPAATPSRIFTMPTATRGTNLGMTTPGFLGQRQAAQPTYAPTPTAVSGLAGPIAAPKPTPTSTMTAMTPAAMMGAPVGLPGTPSAQSAVERYLTPEEASQVANYQQILSQSLPSALAGQLPEQIARQATNQIRGAQAARGLARSGMGTQQEAEILTGLGEQYRAQRMAEALAAMQGLGGVGATARQARSTAAQQAMQALGTTPGMPSVPVPVATTYGLAGQGAPQLTPSYPQASPASAALTGLGQVITAATLGKKLGGLG